jgi:hypothetical protein
MYTKPGPWYLPLRGTPCAVCGKAAERLAVFPAERIITHAENEWPPCHLPNPPLAAASTDVLVPNTQPRQAA